MQDKYLLAGIAPNRYLFLTVLLVTSNLALLPCLHPGLIVGSDKINPCGLYPRAWCCLAKVRLPFSSI
jgi:hypothetical protein